MVDTNPNRYSVGVTIETATGKTTQTWRDSLESQVEKIRANTRAKAPVGSTVTIRVRRTN